MLLSRLKLNPNNPRTIKDDKFKRLVASIEEFPEMMEKRPLVCVTDVDNKIYPLGGNMRLKAIRELGMKEIPDSWVVLADEWTEEQRREFIIKDNASLGDWDLYDLQENWDLDLISEWGVDLGGVDIDPDEFGEEFTLPDGDKEPFQQMTFTLADEQAEQIKNAISDIKQTDEYKYAETMGNENSNGNALYLIVMQWAEQKI